MATFEDLERAIAALPDTQFHVFTASKKPPTERDLLDLEKQLGRALPKGLRTLLARWGVLVVEVSPEIWPRPKELDVVPAWRFQYGFQVLGVGSAIPGELRIAGVRFDKLAALGGVPFLRRMGVPFLSVSTRTGVGTWQPGDVAVEEGSGDELDRILFELRELQDGIAKLNTQTSGTEELMARGRAVKWKGSRASEVLEALQGRPATELAPHVQELAKTLLRKNADLAMGCLDVLAAAGQEAFPSVAETVYSHYGRSDDPYVLELLGKVLDTSKRALELYEEGLGADDNDVVEKALEALGVIAHLPAAKKLVGALEEKLDGEDDDGEHRAAIVVLLGRLGATRFESDVAAILDGGDDEVANLIDELANAPMLATPLAPRLLVRFGAMPPSKPATFNAAAALVKLGVKDRASMEPVAKAFAVKGGMWAERAKELLARLR